MSLALARAIVAVGLLAALPACTPGPKYSRPSVPAPPAYKELPGSDQWKTATPSEAALRGNWWELFGDAQLNQLAPTVSISNQNVLQAEALFREARALVALNRAQAFPIVTTQPSVTTSQSSGNLGGHRVGGPGVFTLFSLPVSATWEPDLWGRVRLAVRNAEANAQASAAELENMRLSMQGELAADYFQLRALDMQEQLLRDTVAAYERSLELTIFRNLQGVSSRLDVAQAQAQLEATRAQLTDLGIARAQFEHAIAVLTGQPPAVFAIPPGRILNTPPPIPAGVPSLLLERRPDIASAERRVAAANAEIGLARVAYFPALSIGVTGGLESSKISSLFTWPSRFWSVGPNLAFTLFDFGRRRAQARQAEAAYDATVAAYRQTVLTAFQEVEDNLAALRLLAEEAAQQDAAIRAAQEALALELERYRAGTTSYLDVIISQTILLGNQRAAIAILQRHMSAAVQLIRALGGGWDASNLPSGSALRKSP